jgi:hypothetical protein
VTYWEFLHWLVEHDYIVEAVTDLRSLHWDDDAIICWISNVVDSST